LPAPPELRAHSCAPLRVQLAVRHENLAVHCENLAVHCENLAVHCENLAVHCENLAVHCKNLAVHCENLAVHCKNLAVNRENLAVNRENLAVNCENLAVNCENLAVNRENLAVCHEYEEALSLRLQGVIRPAPEGRNLCSPTRQGWGPVRVVVLSPVGAAYPQNLERVAEADEELEGVFVDVAVQRHGYVESQRPDRR
jgi:predicted O-linked N-acetylglucosamine transferase (SPINDLY family)